MLFSLPFYLFAVVTLVAEGAVPTRRPTVPPTRRPSRAPTTARPSRANPTKAPTTARPTNAPTVPVPTNAPTLSLKDFVYDNVLTNTLFLCNGTLSTYVGDCGEAIVPGPDGVPTNLSDLLNQLCSDVEYAANEFENEYEDITWGGDSVGDFQAEEIVPEEDAPSKKLRGE
jgi:hypothetical protein